MQEKIKWHDHAWTQKPIGLDDNWCNDKASDILGRVKLEQFPDAKFQIKMIVVVFVKSIRIILDGN